LNRLSNIGSLLKKIYRSYSELMLSGLQSRGFTDLRPSFLEVLVVICELENPNIKEIGRGCGLKKQTMTSHLNELEKRGYILRSHNPLDKREQLVRLTTFGERFKLSLIEVTQEVEKNFNDRIGALEMTRLELILKTVELKTESLLGDSQNLLL
jgi:DNA-binding MarR family transcriptional regulator